MSRNYKEGISIYTEDGSFWIWTVEEWWFYAWSAVAYAMQFEKFGSCVSCDCKISECAYCLHECYISK
jgi:hypothetical protein